MSEVTLIIGGRRHAVSCADGEEAHIADLGRLIDEKYTQLGNPTGPDSQNMLFAALLLADELHEARAAELAAEKARQRLAEKCDSLVEEVEKLRSTPDTASVPEMSANNAELAPALERFAELLENCADKLETKAPKD